MAFQFQTDFIAVGGNRHPCAAAWDRLSGLVAYGADRNIALWDPLGSDKQGIRALLAGHSDKVNAVAFYNVASLKEPLILSGSVDKTIRVWRINRSHLELSGTVCVVSDSDATINTIAVEPHSGIFASGSADATIRIRKIEINSDGGVMVSLLQKISLTPRFFPLALSLSCLGGPSSTLILAAGGTKNIVQVFVAESGEDTAQFELCATLTGHEGWIRSLCFTSEKEDEEADADLILASASQDKYIRLWRVHQGGDLPPAATASVDPALGILGKSLSNKAHRFRADEKEYSVTFEALLLGHDDWIYTVSWFQSGDKLQLLSASADSSLAVWESEKSSGVWVCRARLGEISGLKGATTATGSTGGYWIGLWSPTGESVISLGRTGGWRQWHYQPNEDRWVQDTAVSGHVREVTGIAWARDGSYLLSTSSDQTTRLFAEWKRDALKSWHEFSRPQIHGYDLNCIDMLDSTKFVSGADEKLLRVFEQPKSVAGMLQRLCGIEAPAQMMPDAASIPVLGLSNKATANEVEDEPPGVETEITKDAEEESTSLASPAAPSQNPILDLAHPPTEDHLARHTLWPESEKLYGHGYEISALACSHDGKLVATACRASSEKHAVIRIYETYEWRQVEPPLTAHSLTVTRLRFSDDDRYLLSVGRDRQWTIFQRDNGKEPKRYSKISCDPKAHFRMILDAAWMPVLDGRRTFVTVGRDKFAKIWQFSETAADDVVCKGSLPASCPVTSVDCLPRPTTEAEEKILVHIALGFENGSLQVLSFMLGPFWSPSNSMPSATDFNNGVNLIADYILPPQLVSKTAITQIAWRPSRTGAINNNEAGLKTINQSTSINQEEQEREHSKIEDTILNDAPYQRQENYQLAIAGIDSSIKIFSFNST
ncbi:MAG: hypothetical protein M1823_002519 [Watsoniomyces obsoletus]|nr:MAG: hypothetical protein M1823_002519 [Watsoniomyces obsoletus]